MTRLECVVARAYQPRSRFVSYSHSLSRSLARSYSLYRVTADFYVVGDKKSAYIFLCEAPSRKIRFTSIGNSHARALPFFPSFARLSRIAEWIVIGYNRSRCRLPPPPSVAVNMLRYSPVCYLSSIADVTRL